MATKTVTLNDGGYTKLDTTSDSAIDMQNVSKSPVRLAFAASDPGKSTQAFYLLQPGQGIARDGKSGDMWAMVMGADSAQVTVGE